jgi:hypothetical protein
LKTLSSEFGPIISLEDHFNRYMQDLEVSILEVGARKQLIGHIEYRSVHPGRLHKTKFGDKMGIYIDSPFSFSVDYYGHLKKSRGLLKEINKIRRQCYGKQVKAMTFWVIHFASLRIETVALLNHQLVSGFPLFKRELLDLRGFKLKPASACTEEVICCP